VAFVDGGSVLLGLPGAPGCTTTGVAGSACCARTEQQKKPVAEFAASSMPHSTADLLAGFRLVTHPGVGSLAALARACRRSELPHLLL
jgi:hypothetical protein